MTTTSPNPTPDAEAIAELFEQNEKKDLLRFVTAGSVDDGKSTLIGRLLFESKGIYEDQLESVRTASGRKGSAHQDLDLSLVTDGLKSEREQGITIDVAYRYFSTPRRKFIIADTPGHEQYTRNMVTGASTADLAIILVDASQGVLVQSRRHSYLASLLGIPHLVVAVNKMDLVDYSEKVYREIEEEYSDFAARLDVKEITMIPISALAGDNVVNRSERMPWYKGSTLLNHLETVKLVADRNFRDFRLPVQYVSRPSPDFRGYMSTVTSGEIRPGDDVMVLPSRKQSTVRDIYDVTGDTIPEAFPPKAVTVTLEDEIDISRGDMLVRPDNLPRVDNRFEAMLVWMAEEPMEPGRQYLIKHTTNRVPGAIIELKHRVDVNTLEQHQADRLELNEIGRCSIELARQVAFDSYRQNRGTGSFIVIDRLSHNTVAAGMILPRFRQEKREKRQWTRKPTSLITDQERQQRLGHAPATLWITGLTGAGKGQIAFEIERALFDRRVAACVVDSRLAREGLSSDLDFSIPDRAENVRRVGQVAKLLNRSGIVAICSLLSPRAQDRRHVREIIGDGRFFEIYLSAPREACHQRLESVGKDNPEIDHLERHFPAYEPPKHPELVLPTHELDVHQCVDQILEMLRERGILG
ncbi:MAG: sulfate adenylyltransferase subunit CysN [Phycisphaeraceae bacterium]